MDGGLTLIIVMISLGIAKKIHGAMHTLRMRRALTGDLEPMLALGGGTQPIDADGTIPAGLEIGRSDDAPLHVGHILGHKLEAGFYVRRWEEGISDDRDNRTAIQLTRRVVYVQAEPRQPSTQPLRLSNTRDFAGRTWMRDNANGPDVLLSDDRVRIEYIGHFPPELPPRTLLPRCLQLVLALSHDDETCGGILAESLNLDLPALEPILDGIGAEHWGVPLAPMPLSLKDRFFDLVLSHFPETTAARNAAHRMDADEDVDRGARALLVRCAQPETSEEKRRYREAVISPLIGPKVRTVAFERLWPTLPASEQQALLFTVVAHLVPPLTDRVFEVVSTAPHDVALALIDEALSHNDPQYARAIHRALAQLAPHDTGPRLLKLLALTEGHLATQTAALLVAHGHQDQLEHRLIELLATHENDRRDFAIITLGAYGSAQAVAPLQELIGGWPSSELKQMVKTSVSEIQERATVGAGGLALTTESDTAGGLSNVDETGKAGALSTPDRDA